MTTTKKGGRRPAPKRATASSSNKTAVGKRATAAKAAKARPGKPAASATEEHAKRGWWPPPRELCPKCGERALPLPSRSTQEASWRCANPSCSAIEWTRPRLGS